MIKGESKSRYRTASTTNGNNNLLLEEDASEYLLLLRAPKFGFVVNAACAAAVVTLKTGLTVSKKKFWASKRRNRNHFVRGTPVTPGAALFLVA